MKILMYAFDDKSTGLGHRYRTIRMAQVAEQRGHEAIVAGNIMSRDLIVRQVRKNHEGDFENLVKKFKPDWIIADIPGTLPEFLFGKYQTALINGVGHHRYRTGATVTFQQGVCFPASSTIIGGPKYLILRPELFKSKRSPGKAWFVFGGSRDQMNLIELFHNQMPDDYAMLVAGRYQGQINIFETDKHLLYYPLDEAIFRLMSRAAYGFVAMGMVAWELIAMNVPTYVVSYTHEHMDEAVQMARLGLVRTVKTNYSIGIIDFKMLISQSPVEPEIKLDDLGAQRILEVLE